MNEIEKRFYDAFVHGMGEEESNIKPGEVIGPYRVDFLCYENIVVEIDGHEAHKTKEQRDKDYKRERYLQKEGYIVVRFMGTEVFLCSSRCVEDTIAIQVLFSEKILDAYEEGIHAGTEEAKEYFGISNSAHVR